MPNILPYYSKKSQIFQNHKFPLTSRKNTIMDLNSSSNHKPLTSYRRSYSKKYNNVLNSKKLKIDKKLLYVFKDPKEKYKQKFVWPKITQPKLPFSERNIVPIEQRRKKILEQKPSHLFHNFYTIKWLRQKYSDSLIEKSVFSMLPDNGKPVVPDDESEEDKKHRLLMEYLNSLYSKQPEREKYVNINPKYFFDKRTFEKILKFKEIFLEFDEDQSRKMEIDEMVEMFNQNHINANLRDLVNLFFKGKKIKEEDIMKLYLDFYQFMNFALTKDQDFREFMREIKLKSKKNEDGFNSNKSEEEENGYLPMNFNLMFDYFLVKGKERASIEAIENSINEMEKIINKDKNIEEKRNVNNNEEKIVNPNLKNQNSLDLNKNQIEEENDENSKYYDEQLKNLNFCDLMENFTNLFNVNDLTNNNKNFIEEKKEKTSNEEEGKIGNEDEKTNNNKKNKALINESSDAMTEFLQNKMNKITIKKMNIKNYKKFHNVKLALNATKDQVKTFIKSNGNKFNTLYKIRLNNENNNKEIKSIQSAIFPYFRSKTNNNDLHNKEKQLLKTKTLLLFNKNIINKKDINEGNKRAISFVKEKKINLIDDKKKRLLFVNNYSNKINRTNCKLDYVPPELLQIKLYNK